MDCSRAGFPVHHQLLELTQTHVHRVGDAIQPCFYFIKRPKDTDFPKTEKELTLLPSDVWVFVNRSHLLMFHYMYHPPSRNIYTFWLPTYLFAAVCQGYLSGDIRATVFSDVLE